MFKTILGYAESSSLLWGLSAIQGNKILSNALKNDLCVNTSIDELLTAKKQTLKNAKLLRL